MGDFASFQKLVSRIDEVRKAIFAAQSAPAEARKALSGAVVGHKGWDGYGLREIRCKDLHERAVAAVTDYLVADLAERKHAELVALADELDALREQLVADAAALRFNLLDNVLSARTWFSTATEGK